MKKVSAVVVTYNRKELLKKNIESLLAQDYRDVDILVVDNASTDGTREYIDEYIKDNRIIYYNTDLNLGGAGGFNFGIKKAISQGYEYIWVMDDDTIPFDNALSKLMEADQRLDGNYGFLASKVLWRDGSVCKMNRQKFVRNGKNHAAYLEYGYMPIYHTTFVSFFVKTKVVLSEGLPIKEFFIWGDDVEYSGRLAKKYDCYLVEQSKVLHNTENNEGSNIARDDVVRIDRYRFAYRNEMYIAKKNGIKGLLRQIAKIMLHMFRVLVYGEHKFKKWGVILGGSFKGIAFEPQVEYLEK